MNFTLHNTRRLLAAAGFAAGLVALACGGAGGTAMTDSDTTGDPSDADSDSDPGTETDDPSAGPTSDTGTSDPGTSDPGTSDPGTSDPGTSDPGTSDPGTTGDPTTGTTGDPTTGTTGGFDPGDPGVQLCGEEFPMDAAEILAASIAGDSLDLKVQYSGGCEQHDFGLCWDGIFAESEPVQVWVDLAHDGHMDPCDALPTEDVSLDLTPLKDAWHDSYGPGPGTITIHLDGWGQALTYNF